MRPATALKLQVSVYAVINYWRVDVKRSKRKNDIKTAENINVLFFTFMQRRLMKISAVNFSSYHL